MGAEYTFYTEIKRDGKWHALNGMYYSEKENEYMLAATYWNGSRSYFGSTYQKFCELGTCINAQDLSGEILRKENWIDEKLEVPIAIVSWKKFLEAIPETKRKELCGYVHKRWIWEYEVNGSDIDEYYSSAEYDELSEAEKKEYEFYEWDDPFGWYSYFKHIADKVKCQIDNYMAVNEMWDEPENIRIVCIASW